jgi:hypothetical protein
MPACHKRASRFCLTAAVRMQRSAHLLHVWRCHVGAGGAGSTHARQRPPAGPGACPAAQRARLPGVCARAASDMPLFSCLLPKQTRHVCGLPGQCVFVRPVDARLACDLLGPWLERQVHLVLFLPVMAQGTHSGDGTKGPTAPTPAGGDPSGSSLTSPAAAPTSPQPTQPVVEEEAPLEPAASDPAGQLTACASPPPKPLTADVAVGTASGPGSPRPASPAAPAAAQVEGACPAAPVAAACSSSAVPPLTAATDVADSPAMGAEAGDSPAAGAREQQGDVCEYEATVRQPQAACSTSPAAPPLYSACSPPVC